MIEPPQKDEAVSPVVATIMMIAVTVLLAGVVSAYVFGVAENPSNSKIVAIIASNYTSSGVTFTIHGGGEIQELTTLDIIQGGTTTNWPNPKVGDTKFFTFSSQPLTVVGTFTDGEQQVLWMDAMTSATTSLDKNVGASKGPTLVAGVNFRTLQYTFSGTGTGNIQSITGFDGTGTNVD